MQLLHSSGRQSDKKHAELSRILQRALRMTYALFFWGGVPCCSFSIINYIGAPLARAMKLRSVGSRAPAVV